MSAVAPDPLALPPPWYRQFWPWALIAIPGVSVALGVLMIALATSGHDALVVDDWYKQGKGINRRIERDAEATRLGLAARVERAPDALALELSATDARFDVPAALDVRWVHVTRADRDGGATFTHVGRGRYVAAGAALPEGGRWRLHVEPRADGTAGEMTDGTAGEPGGEAPDATSEAAAPAWRLVGEPTALGPDTVPSVSADAAPVLATPAR